MTSDGLFNNVDEWEIASTLGPFELKRAPTDADGTVVLHCKIVTEDFDSSLLRFDPPFISITKENYLSKEEIQFKILKKRSVSEYHGPNPSVECSAITSRSERMPLVILASSSKDVDDNKNHVPKNTSNNEQFTFGSYIFAFGVWAGFIVLFYCIFWPSTNQPQLKRRMMKQNSNNKTTLRSKNKRNNNKRVSPATPSHDYSSSEPSASTEEEEEEAVETEPSMIIDSTLSNTPYSSVKFLNVDDEDNEEERPGCSEEEPTKEENTGGIGSDDHKQQREGEKNRNLAATTTTHDEYKTNDIHTIKNAPQISSSDQPATTDKKAIQQSTGRKTAAATTTTTTATTATTTSSSTTMDASSGTMDKSSESAKQTNDLMAQKRKIAMKTNKKGKRSTMMVSSSHSLGSSSSSNSSSNLSASRKSSDPHKMLSKKIGNSNKKCLSSVSSKTYPSNQVNRMQLDTTVDHLNKSVSALKNNTDTSKKSNSMKHSGSNNSNKNNISTTRYLGDNKILVPSPSPLLLGFSSEQRPLSLMDELNNGSTTLEVVPVSSRYGCNLKSLAPSRPSANEISTSSGDDAINFTPESVAAQPLLKLDLPALSVTPGTQVQTTSCHSTSNLIRRPLDSSDNVSFSMETPCDSPTRKMPRRHSSSPTKGFCQGDSNRCVVQNNSTDNHQPDAIHAPHFSPTKTPRRHSDLPLGAVCFAGNRSGGVEFSTGIASSAAKTPHESATKMTRRHSNDNTYYSMPTSAVIDEDSVPKPPRSNEGASPRSTIDELHQYLGITETGSKDTTTTTSEIPPNLSNKSTSDFYHIKNDSIAYSNSFEEELRPTDQGMLHKATPKSKTTSELESFPHAPPGLEVKYDHDIGKYRLQLSPRRDTECHQSAIIHQQKCSAARTSNTCSGKEDSCDLVPSRNFKYGKASSSVPVNSLSEPWYQNDLDKTAENLLSNI